MAAREPEDGTSPLCIRLFGPIDVRRDGAPLPRLHSRKGLWLLALLTLRYPSAVDRDWLAGVLWPDSDETQALAGLRNTLADLRRALGPQAGRLCSPTTQTLSLDLTGAEVDVLRFDAAVGRGDTPSLEQAVALYRGPLLEGCVEEWVLPERERWEQAYLSALERLAAEALGRRDHAAAEGYLRRVAAVDPTRESAQRALMQVLAESGNHAAATQAFRELRLHLHRELNAQPDAETTALYEQIRAEARRRAQAQPVLAGEGSVVLPDVLAGPAGAATLTFLFTDIEGSTKRWEAHPEAMREALGRHDTILRTVVTANGGRVFKTVGDGICAAFPTAPEALAAAGEGQRALQGAEWPEVGPLRVRMALYTGIAEERGEDYVGPPLNRVARLLAAGHGGQILLSSATQELARDKLPEGSRLRDLGRHRLADVPHPEHVFQLVHTELPDPFPPLKSLGAAPNNLPRQLTTFIGREKEMTEVKRLLATTYLLTLTGTGGCGKTRLALQAAGELLAEYEDGVWLVELAALADPGLVPQAVATALGVREEAGRSLTQILAEHLRPKSLLLVLDNCEHLVGACAELAEALLRGCPDLRILATSREALGIVGEQAYLVPSLSLPTARRLSLEAADAVSALAQYEAVRLFIDRATSTLPTFTVTDRNAPAVVQVCQRLDGMPLAVELAAARVKALAVEQIAARLDDRFRLLTGGSRTALPRHQTLQAAIDWSYELLSEAERVLMRRLSVFAGGWTLEAAEAVCAGADVEEYELFDVLARLVDKSLVIADERGGEARYRFLETVRQYGRERLVEAGETQSVQRRHRDWYLAVVEEAEPYLTGPDQARWLERLQEEHDNLRSALQSALETDPEAALRMAGALWRFWMIRGYYAEGRQQLGAALERGRGGRADRRAKALTGAGSMAWRQGDYDWAIAFHEQGLALYHEVGDKRGIAFALCCLGGQANLQGDYDRAELLVEQGLALYRELQDNAGAAVALGNLGVSATYRGEYGRAATLFQEELTLERELKNKQGIANALHNLGDVARYQGNYEQASAFLEECLPLCREVDDKWMTTLTLTILGLVALHQGRYARALSLQREALAVCRETGDKLGTVQCLEGIAGAYAQRGQPEQAARWFGAAEALRGAIGAPLPPVDQPDYERSVAAARAGLEKETFAAAWVEGRAMTMEQALAIASEETASS